MFNSCFVCVCVWTEKDWIKNRKCISQPYIMSLRDPMHSGNAAFATGLKNMLQLMFKKCLEMQSGTYDKVGLFVDKMKNRIASWIDDHSDESVHISNWNAIHTQMNNVLRSLAKKEPPRLQVVEIQVKMAMRALQEWMGPAMVQFWFDCVNPQQGNDNEEKDEKLIKLEHHVLLCLMEWIFFQVFRRLMVWPVNVQGYILAKAEKQISSCM